MMDLHIFIQNIGGFSSWSHADKIKFFAWHLHTRRNQEHFRQAEIRRCYEDLHLDQPANIGSYLAAMASRRPREALKTSSGYRLELRIRAQFDTKYGHRASTVLIDKLLSELPTKVSDLAERTYLDETLACFRSGAFRATIIMCWNMAYSHLCDYLFNKHLATFNSALARTFPRVSLVGGRDDFSEMKESQVLQVCRTAGITSVSIDKILKEKLGRRNMAAHPSSVGIHQLTAEETVKDLIENVIVKLV